MLEKKSSCLRAFRFSACSLSSLVSLLMALLLSFAPPEFRSKVQAASMLQQPAAVVTVSAASYSPTVAPDSIVAAFGVGLATEVRAATTIPLPTSLAGTVVRVNGEAAPLFFVSPNQINYLLPSGTPAGIASVVVTSGDGKVSSGTVQVADMAPALFTADASGSGALAAQLLRLKANGQLIYEPLAIIDGGKPVTRPIEFGEASDQLFLILYLTGVRQAATSDVRVNLGGVEFVPLYAGSSGGFVGLDQINVSLPRNFGGRGRLALLVSVNGAGGSNSGEVEISAATAANAQLQLDSLNNAPTLVGQELEISGSGFAATPRENQVQIVADDGVTTKAEVLSGGGNRLRIRVPFGAGSGRLRVLRGQAEASASINVRTSISGFVETTTRQPLANATVRLLTGQSVITTTSNANGSFVLPDAPGGAALIEVDGTTAPASPPFPKVTLKLSVRASRDNQFQQPIALQQGTTQTTPAGASSLSLETTSSEAASIQEGNLIFDLPNGATVQCPDGTNPCALALAQLTGSRTPENLPRAQFSSVIAQLTPFGAKFTPGGKLTFPNTDTLPASAQATLFKFDQTAGSATFGTFIAAGTVIVSEDGQRIETAASAVTEGSYYFASVERPLAAINGRVVESDGRPVPRAVVRARGQSTFTDGFGGFVLRAVPVLKANGDQVKVEVSYQRPSGSVSRRDSEAVELRSGELATIKAEIVLEPVMTNSPPVILAPSSLTLNAGEIRDFDFSVTDPDSSQSLQVSRSGTAASFTALSNPGEGIYRLHLTPATNNTGSFALNLTATDAANDPVLHSIIVTVHQSDPGKPLAHPQSVTLLEDTTRALTLTGTDPNSGTLTWTVVSVPLHGSLSGTAPNLLYTPVSNYNGTDSFTFKASNGQAESSTATIFLAVTPVNDTPTLTVPGAQNVTAGAALRFIVSAMDVDEGQMLNFSAQNLPDGATFTQAGATAWQLNWTPAFAQAGTHTITFKVTDNGHPARSQSQDVTITTDVLWAKTSGPEGAFIRFLSTHGKFVFAGGDGGILRSADEGKTWVEINQGLVEPITYSVVAVGDTLFAASHFGGVHRSINNGDTWVQSSRGIAFDRFPFLTGLKVSGTTIYAYTRNGRVYRSIDLGNNWVSISSGLPSDRINDLLVSGTTLLAATGQGVYRAGLEGNNWVPARMGLPQNLSGAFLRTWSFARLNGVVYVGTDSGGVSGGVFRSANNGETWTAINSGLPNQAVLALSVKGTTLYAGVFGGGVYRLGSNETWVKIGSGLTDSLIWSLDFSGSTFYAGTERGGIYRSTDQAENFTPANSGVNQQATFSLFATDQFLLAGTQSGGLFRSTSNGETWSLSNTGLPRSEIRELVRIGNTLFAAARESGVYRSTNLGLSWQAVNNGLTKPVLVMVTNGNTLLAGGSGGVFRSTDSGANWTDLSNGLSNYEIRSLAINGTTLFAGTLITNIDGTAGPGLLRSTDNGATWQPANNGVRLLPGNITGNVDDIKVGGGILYASFNGQLYRSVNNGDTWTATDGGFFGGGINRLVISGNTFFAGTFGGGVFRSEDGGDHWMPFNAGLKGPRILSLARHGNTLFAGSYSGVFRATPGTQAWTEINTGLATCFVNTIAASQGNLYAGASGSGVFRSTSQGRTWTAASSGLPANANVQSIVASGNTLFAGLFGDGIYISTDQGQNWRAVNTGLTSRLVNKLFISGSTIYAGTDGGVFRSTDAGESWTAFSVGLGHLRVLSFAANAGTIFAGTDGSGIFRLQADGTGWTPVSQGLTNLEVTALFVSGALYAGTNGGGVFISHNGGERWMAVNNNLPATLNVFAFAASGQKVYAGSIYGVFVTEDEGQTWRQINAGLLETYVSGLVVSGEQLLASTVRGGVFVSQIPASGETFLPPQDCSSQSSLRSLEGKIPTTIEFINSSTQTRRIYWLNYSGQLVRFNTLNPGQRYVQGTFVTHPWVVTDAADQCLGIYLPLREPAKALLR